MSFRLYLDALTEHENEFRLSVATAICIFVSEFCSFSRDHIILVNRIPKDKISQTVVVNHEVLDGATIIQPEELPSSIKDCQFPAAIGSNGRIVHLGLCAVLRQMVKSTKSVEYILGEKKNCLKACAEVSVWTKFCEVQMPSAVEKFLHLRKSVNDDHGSLGVDAIPDELLQLENHFSTPPVVSNVNKIRKEIYKRKVTEERSQNETKICDKDISIQKNEVKLEHVFVEGLDLLLTDVTIFPCVSLILNEWIKFNDLCLIQLHLKEVFGWYSRVLAVPMVRKTLMSVGLPVVSVEQHDVEMQAAHSDVFMERNLPLIRDPKKTKFCVSQRTIEEAFAKVEASNIQTKLQQNRFGDVCLPWDTFPSSVHPKDGDLPLKRLEKKCQQLENLVAAVKFIARPDDTIVDFCSGGGHLGLLLAFLLPSCSVVLVENKEESLSRALNRIETLKLTNVSVYQSNLDYFDLPFSIGVCLHGCGVATDLVLEKCLNRLASFVVCPCCYGAIQNTHTVSYPRSEAFEKAELSYEDFLVLAHAADQTQAKIVQAEQGKRAMEYVDTDRLNLAEFYGYQTSLCTMTPPSCSPKNNLLVGVTLDRDTYVSMMP